MSKSTETEHEKTWTETFGLPHAEDKAETEAEAEHEHEKTWVETFGLPGGERES